MWDFFDFSGINKIDFVLQVQGSQLVTQQQVQQASTLHNRYYILKTKCTTQPHPHPHPRQMRKLH